MLLININYILYKLIWSRSFIIKQINGSEEILLADNSICFLLPKIESKKIKLPNQKEGFNILHTYETLIYKDEIYNSLLKHYPAILKNKLQYQLFLPNILKLLNSSIKPEGVKSLALKRTKTGFTFNCLGLVNSVSFFNYFETFCSEWQHKNSNFVGSKRIFKTMLYWLHKKMYYETGPFFLSIKKKEKPIKIKGKKIIKKIYLKPFLFYAV